MFIKRLRLKKLLSFNDTEVELRQLNVLIGPNAVGKSNLIEAVSLLQAAPSSLEGTLHRGGGVRQWLSLSDRSPIATVECELSLSRGPLAYRLKFLEDAGLPAGFVIHSELLTKSGPHANSEDPDAYFTRGLGRVAFGHVPESTSPVSPTESVLSLYKSPVDPTPITEVGREFEQIRIFREFRTLGPRSEEHT